jgi:hypothetical protein
MKPMKPIEIFVYKGTTSPKLEDYCYSDALKGFVQADYDYPVSEVRDIYTRYEIQPPEWATHFRYLFDKDVQCQEYVGYQEYSGTRIPLPQPEKRCRWRYKIGDFVWETTKAYSKKDVDKQYGIWGPMPEPIEDDPT